jgi:hypothetical protein
VAQVTAVPFSRACRGWRGEDDDDLLAGWISEGVWWAGPWLGCSLGQCWWACWATAAW